MCYVYILYSAKSKRYYTGSTGLDPMERLERHNSEYYEDKFTAKGRPWVLFLSIACESRKQAENIERHIKKMKSKRYIENLGSYEEMRQKLLTKYSEERESEPR